jgi:hypothetical protein
MEEFKMRKLLFVTMLIALSAPAASAQKAATTRDLPSDPNASDAPDTTRWYSFSRGGMARRDPRAMQDLIDGWKASKDAGVRDKIEQALRDALTSEFNDRLAAHEREIKDLEAKVRELRDRLNLRREKQEEIVDHRLQQILREAQGLGWGSETHAPGYGYGWAYGEAGTEGGYGRGGYGGGYGEYGRGGREVPTSPARTPSPPSAFDPVPVEEPPAADPAPTERDP